MPKSSAYLTSIESRIHLIRGHRVMLDADLAGLYGVPTKALLQAIKRHGSRFPSDFMFILSTKEFQNLRSQFVTSSWGGRRYRPYVFTEQGVAMLSSVLNSERAVRVNIAIMRAFVKMRHLALTREELAARLQALERSVEGHDSQIRDIIQAIERLLIAPPGEPKTPIGFRERPAAYRVKKAVPA